MAQRPPIKTFDDALMALDSISGELAVSEATLEDPWDDPEWSWQEQHELSQRIAEIAAVLRRKGA